MTHRTYYECEDGTVIADEIMDGDIHTGMNVRFTKPFKTSDPDWKKRIQSQAKAKGVTARFRTGKWERRVFKSLRMVIATKTANS